MSGVIGACGWCPTMDLLALLIHPLTPLASPTPFSSSTPSPLTLHIHRLASDEPRLFSLPLLDAQPPAEVGAAGGCEVAWRIDGKAVAVATSEGGVQVVGMESRKVEVAYQPHRYAITHLQWLQLHTGHSNDRAQRGRKRRSRTRQAATPAAWRAVDVSSLSLPLRDLPSSRSARSLFPPLPPLPSHSSSSTTGPAPSPTPMSAPASSSSDASLTIAPSIVVDGDQLPPTLLVTGDSGGFVHVRLHATLDVLQLNVKDSLPHSLHPLSLSVHSFALSPSFDALHVVVRSDDPQQQQPQLLLVRVALPLLSQRIHELSLLACHVQHISHLLSYASSALTSVTSRYQSIRQSLSNKFSPLTSTLTEHGLPDTSPAEHLVHLALTSIPSTAVMQWISSTLHPAALLRQCSGVESGLWRMMDVLRVNVRRAMEEVVHRLAEVRALSRWKERGGEIGVEESVITQLLHQAGLVLMRTEEVMLLVGTVRRGFTAFFHWLAYQVSVLQREDEEGDKEQPSGPFELDDVVDCIQQDVFSDRLAQPLSSTPPPSASLSPRPHSSSAVTSSLPVSAIPTAESSISLLTALDALRESFAAFTQTPCAAISQATAQAQRRSEGQEAAVIKVAQEQPIGAPAPQDIAFCFDPERERLMMAFSLVHPLAPHPLLVVISTPSASPKHFSPSSSTSSPGPSALVLPCPGLTGSSQPSIVSVAFFTPQSLLVLVRYAVHRRSSELRQLHEKEKMVGNVYTRLFQIPLQGKRGWREMREAERRRDGLGLADWAVAEWERWEGAGVGRDERRWKQRSLYGDCGRSLSVGRERGVCSLLLTALQPHRARQQQRRILTLDLLDDEEEQRAEDDGQEEELPEDAQQSRELRDDSVAMSD